jgi:hypothetical protein
MPRAASSLEDLAELTRQLDEAAPEVPAGVGLLRLPDAAAVRAELEAVHGIRVLGPVAPRDWVHLRLFARFYRPDETRGLTFDFLPIRNDRGGNLGEWDDGDGTATIRGTRADTLFHEGTHHVLGLSGHDRARRIGALIVAAAHRAGGGRLPLSCLTRPYALRHASQGDHAEFLAELVTGVACLEHGIPGGITLANPRFDPPEEVRRLVRSLWEGSAGR